MQKSRIALKTQVNARFPDNTTGTITPAFAREVLGDIIDSFFNTLDDVSGGDAFVVRLQGFWDASGNAFPEAPSDEVLGGYLWKISVAGDLAGTSVEPGAKIMAMVDNPGQVLENWDISY